MITVAKAPPYLVVQDGGRQRSRSSGVPRGGAMDRYCLETLNAIVGNPQGAAGLEWALGSGVLRFEAPCAVAFGGAVADVSHSERAVRPFTTLAARSGDELKVEGFRRGRFLYLAFSGGIDVPEVLGSRSTYLLAHFGGLSGRTLTSGDTLPLGKSSNLVPRAGFSPRADLLPQYDTGSIRVTRGTHADLLGQMAWRTLTEGEFSVAMASDRTGYRLAGPTITHSLIDLPSDPGCEGAIQVPGDGNPIVLMADAPTIGGYPKLAVVSEADLSCLAQRTPGEPVRFEAISIEESQRALRKRTSDLNLIRSAGAASA